MAGQRAFCALRAVWRDGGGLVEPMGVIGTFLGAVVGALVWGGLTYATGYEIGYVAWGIGALVGIGAKLGGARGTTASGMAAALALVSIFVGKVLAVKFGAPAEIRKMAAGQFTHERFDEVQKDAEAYASVTGEDELRQFLIDRGYSEAAVPAAVSFDEISKFKADQAHQLERFQSQHPTFEGWQKGMTENAVTQVMARVSLPELVVENLGPVDALFAFFGISTAFKIVAQGGAESAPARPRPGGTMPAGRTGTAGVRPGAPPSGGVPPRRDRPGGPGAA